MCGIAGMVSFAGAVPPTEDELRRMNACIAHRGPDGEGLLFAEGRGGIRAGFAHRRLAILDPDPRSNQPFSATYHGRRVHLVFNGEIYNFRDVRGKLERELPGFPWRTTGDTEVVLAAYLAWGDQCVEDLLGMFAFAVFDEADGSLLLARDRMGEKPLYVTERQGRIAFASELSAIASLDWPDLSISDAALTEYLSFGYINAPRTIYAGVEKLPPGTTRRYLGSQVPREIAYFQPNEVKEPPSDLVAATRVRVEEAVAAQLVSDVPLGCFLSGGIDSSITTLCAHRALTKHAKGPLRTFTAKFDDPRYDESPFAEGVARRLGTTHHTFTVHPNAAEDLPGLAASYGEPFADSSALPSYYLSRETKKHVKVALSGDGGDELFGGYDRYRAMEVAEKLSPFRAAIPRVSPRGHPKSRVTRMKRFLEGARLTAPLRYELFMRLFPPGMLAAPALSGIIAGQLFPGSDPAGAAMALDRVTYLPGDLLTKIDRASMRCGLEVRAPFMDPGVVSLAASIPATVHLKQGKKSLLRAAFASDLPPAVFTRPKRGFAVPIGEWFRGPLRPLLQDLVLSATGFCATRFDRRALQQLVDDHHTEAADHSQRLYALVMLELWHRQR